MVTTMTELKFRTCRSFPNRSRNLNQVFIVQAQPNLRKNQFVKKRKILVKQIEDDVQNHRFAISIWPGNDEHVFIFREHNIVIKKLKEPSDMNGKDFHGFACWMWIEMRKQTAL